MEDFQRLNLDDTFQFSCHRGISCFNDCCRDLNQFLTPYDILRLKKRLTLSSQQLLRRYTASHIGPRSGLPVVSLRMLDNKDLICPFVTPAGCTVYEDRPGSCRTYPLGRMAVNKPDQSACEEFYFVIEEDHCLGFKEPKQWTVRQWEDDQQLDVYNEMNDLIMGVLSLKNQSNRKTLSDRENRLFYMACYDQDRFRDYASENRLWEKSSPGRHAPESILEDDLALIKFAIEWIKGELFGQ